MAAVLSPPHPREFVGSPNPVEVLGVRCDSSFADDLARRIAVTLSREIAARTDDRLLHDTVTEQSSRLRAATGVALSSERGFIDRALVTSPDQWGSLRDDPPHAQIRALHRRVREMGTLAIRIDDDRSGHARTRITFYSRDWKLLARSYRSVPTNRWVDFPVTAAPKTFSGYVCAEGTDGTSKSSNDACSTNVVR